VVAGVRRLVDLLAPGSYLVIVHDTADIHSEEIETAMRYFMDQGGEPLVARSREEITRFFNGLELVEPGLVTTSRWRPSPSRPVNLRKLKRSPSTLEWRASHSGQPVWP
jgi:hypothetical protein